MATDNPAALAEHSQDDWHPRDSFEPSLCDAIAYFAKIEADERDRQLRADLIRAGINVPPNDQDEDD